MNIFLGLVGFVYDPRTDVFEQEILWQIIYRDTRDFY